MARLSNYQLEARIALEKRIVKAVVEDAIKAGYVLNVNNGGETEELEKPSSDAAEVIAHTMLADEDFLYVYHANGKGAGWVRFVYGNDGWDVVNDYTTNLESVLKQANEISDKAQ